MSDVVIRGRRVVTAEGVGPASVHVRGGTIDAVREWGDVSRSAQLTDVGDAVVMAGIVDSHVHVNEPGRTDWEGFSTATRAAAAGGVTTLFDMPLNSIPATTTVSALAAKRAAAKGKCWTNVGFIGGVVPGNAGDLKSLHDAGVRCFKCFLVPSGVDEFPCVGERDLRLAMPVLAELGATLMVHAELPELIASAPRGDPRRYATYLASRPDEAETRAIALVTALAREFRARVHIVHLSSGQSLPLLRAALRDGVDVTAETCPHYLTFSAEEIRDGATEFKCAPPIRAAATRDELWQGLLSGEIASVVSDHSPCPPALKVMERGDFFAAWGGIASLQLGLPATWTGARARGVGVERMAEWMCAGPARLAGLASRKGRLAAGYDADLVVWDPDAAVIVTPESLHHRHAVTPYSGRTLYGQVLATWVAGRIVYTDGEHVGSPSGTLLT